MSELQRAALFWLFFLLFLSITVVSLLVALQVEPFDNASEAFQKVAVGTVIAGIVGAVLAVYRGAFGLSPAIDIAIEFQGALGVDIDLNPVGQYEVWDQKREQITSPKDILVKTGVGGWVCRLPRNIKLDDSIRLLLKDKNGQKWEVQFFSPLISNRLAIKR